MTVGLGFQRAGASLSGRRGLRAVESAPADEVCDYRHQVKSANSSEVSSGG